MLRAFISWSVKKSARLKTNGLSCLFFGSHGKIVGHFAVVEKYFPFTDAGFYAFLASAFSKLPMFKCVLCSQTMQYKS
jgi:hypothetical protein